MRRLLQPLAAVAVSPLLAPVVGGLVGAGYIVTAVFTDDALVALMEALRRYTPLLVAAWLIPVNLAARLVRETVWHLRRRRTRRGTYPVRRELFDEEVVLARVERDYPRESLADSGYRVAGSGRRLAAWRGVSVFPVRLLFLAGLCALFAGALLSLTWRTSFWEPLVEGEPLPPTLGVEGTLAQINLTRPRGAWILARDLKLEVETLSGPRTFGIYPPGMMNGKLIYLRYLGIAPMIRLSGPGVPAGFGSFFVLSIYPPGKEDTATIPDSPLKLLLSAERPRSGVDPYQSGQFAFSFKAVRDGQVLFEGRAATGETFNAAGYTLAFPDARRTVLVEVVTDPGVPLLWLAALLLVAALVFYVPVRLLFPRREMVFTADGDGVRAGVRSEGRARGNLGVFNEVLDTISAAPDA
jgi:hypothetical protein